MLFGLVFGICLSQLHYFISGAAESTWERAFISRQVPLHPPFEKCGMPNICKAFEELRNVLIYNNGHLVLCQESSLMAHGFMVCINSPQAWRAEMGESSSGQMLDMIFRNI